MSHPSIGDAKAIATKHRRRAVIILAFSEDGVSCASYGMTRKDCDKARDVNNAIMERIEGGEIPVDRSLCKLSLERDRQAAATLRDRQAAATLIDKLLAMLEETKTELYTGKPVPEGHIWYRVDRLIKAAKESLS